MERSASIGAAWRALRVARLSVRGWVGSILTLLFLPAPIRVLQSLCTELAEQLTPQNATLKTNKNFGEWLGQRISARCPVELHV